MSCLDEKILSSYLDERLSEVERQRIEEHVAECRRCLDLLLVAYEAERFSTRPPLANFARTIFRRRGRKQKKARTELKWLFAAVVLFALSFAFKRYFLQFLVAALVLGFKWVMEGEGAKRVVMIFKGIKDEKNFFERKPPPPVSNISEDTDYGAKRT